MNQLKNEPEKPLKWNRIVRNLEGKENMICILKILSASKERIRKKQFPIQTLSDSQISETIENREIERNDQDWTVPVQKWTVEEWICETAQIFKKIWKLI